MRLNSEYFLGIIIILFLYPCCSSLSLDYVSSEIGHRNKHNQNDFAWAGDQGTQNVIRRATQMATIKWTPLCNVPNNCGIFEAGIQVTGIPYSSTKKINKYLGFDVSYHTFMTAVHNPYSVLYSENIGEEPYNGVNCACYYGTVCSASVAYALGLEYPLISDLYPKDSGFQEVDFSSLEDLRPGDVMQRPGHVFMIYKLYKDGDGTISRVTIFESSGTSTTLKNYSSEILLQRINKEGIKPYRYKWISDSPAYISTPYAPIGSEPQIHITYNNGLCPNKGDRSVYRSDEPIVIDVFDTSYDTIVFNKEGQDCFTKKIIGAVNEIGVVEPGRYKVYLRNDKEMSESIELIVAAPKVDVSITDKVHIVFECKHAVPLYCVFASEAGDSIYSHVFDDEEVIKGFADLEVIEGGPYYYKVIFDTPFGTVINDPILAMSI